MVTVFAAEDADVDTGTALPPQRDRAPGADVQARPGRDGEPGVRRRSRWQRAEQATRQQVAPGGPRLPDGHAPAPEAAVGLTPPGGSARGPQGRMRAAGPPAWARRDGRRHRPVAPVCAARSCGPGPGCRSRSPATPCHPSVRAPAGAGAHETCVDAVGGSMVQRHVPANMFDLMAREDKSSRRTISRRRAAVGLPGRPLDAATMPRTRCLEPGPGTRCRQGWPQALCDTPAP